MARGRVLRTAALAALAAVPLVLPACTGSGVEAAHQRALRYFEQVPAADVSWSYLGPHLGRRFGLELALGDGSTLGATGWEGQAEPPTLAPFRRLFRPTARASLEDVEALESPVDRMLGAALHCDHLGLPDGWRGILEDATEVGGYATTHAALALAWSLENGCMHWVDATSLRHRQVEALVALLAAGDELAASDPDAADIWVEALALLYYLDSRERIASAWLDALLALQRPDGGWPEHPGEPTSSPHTTAFALWVLSEELLEPKGSRAMIPRLSGLEQERPQR